MRKRPPNPIDIFVGQRVRMARLMAKMSQEKLGDALGISFQQIQKNEKGANRVAASRLQQLSKILQVPVSWFFDEKSNGHKAEADIVTRMVTAPGGMKLAESFLALKSNAHRQVVTHVAHALAQHG